VTCVYARQGAGRIHYRVVDEYGGDTLSGKSTCTSTKPLSLGQLTNFFLGAWDLLNVLGFNFEHPSYSEDEIKAFDMTTDEAYEGEFGQLIDARIDRWIRSRKRQQLA